VAEWGGFRDVPCWQGICLEKDPEILVALKRNDEYALDIKAVRA
jgi:hypothetical protein